MKITNLFKLLFSIAIPLLAGFVGSLFTMSAIPSWYNYLAKPDLAPPNWIFFPVWTTLYVLMGVAVFIVWQKGWYRKLVKVSLGVFGLQIILNALWSIIFFGLKSPMWAMLDISGLWVLIVINIFLFYKVSKTAGLLLVPYILWVSFASYLNYMIMILN